MKIKVNETIGSIGEITCLVRHKDGTETEYPVENNTHTYGWFNAITGNNADNSGAYYLFNYNNLHVGTGTTPITKTRIGLSAGIAYLSSPSTSNNLYGVTYGGVEYFGRESTYIFPYGSISATIKEVGIGSNPSPATGLHCGKVLTTPVVVTADDQLVVKYKRLYSGAIASYRSDGASTWSSKMPEVATGTLVKGVTTHAWSLRKAVLVDKSTPPTMQYLNYVGSVPASTTEVYWSDTTSGAWSYSYYGGVASGIVTSPKTNQRDSISYTLKQILPPALGTITIARVAFFYLGTIGGYETTAELTFDPPLVKTNEEKLQITMDVTVTWSQP